jgi:ribokinase
MVETLVNRSNSIESIKRSLPSLSSSGNIAVMPDYFVDRFVRFNSIDDLVIAIKRKSYESGGGSIREVSQSEVKGGNAVNLAYSLGKFGASVHLIAIASSLPEQTLRATFANFENVTTDIIKGRSGFTVALEFLEGARHVNVMVSDVGDLEYFDGSNIAESSWARIESSRLVCVVNWAANKQGTALCQKVFSRAKASGSETFLDPADVSGLEEGIRSLKKEIFDKDLVDRFSLNENEARILAKALCSFELPFDFSEMEIQKVTRLISDVTRCEVDLHTRALSVSCRGSDCVSVPTHKVIQKTVTGAGDVWDASDIVGHMLHWDPSQRLLFANAAAGLYVSREDAQAPTFEEVIRFLESHDELY